MNLSEIQLLQQKIAAMTESEFEDWLNELSSGYWDDAFQDGKEVGYEQGSEDGYEEACREHGIEY